MTALPTTATDAGQRMHALAVQLYPYCRSITGTGVRATLRTLAESVPVEIHEVPSGTAVLDWVVPDEWNIEDAFIATSGGERLVDFRESNLHVVSYSERVRAEMTLEELLPHLHTHPTNADWVPYRTSYYSRDWGFCLSQRQLERLEDESSFVVEIDSTLEPGSLTYGELYLPGDTETEVLVSTHVCHPSLANDNLSGIVLLAELAALLAATPHRLSYRFVFVPGTIGSITWLARNLDTVGRIGAGLVVACVGDSGPITYKRSRHGDAVVDRAAAHVVAQRGGRVLDFVPWGWDERQYNSPGFDLPVGCLTRSLDGEFAEYHSSADDLDLVGPEALEESLRAALSVVEVLEHDATYENLSPHGEPQLGRRGLYRAVGGTDPGTRQLALLWMLNQSDGSSSVLDVAERSRLSFSELDAAACDLREAGLLDARGWSLP